MIPCSFLRSPRNQGSFARPELPGFTATTSLSATPTRSACPSRESEEGHDPSRGGASRVACEILRYMPSPIPRRNREVRVVCFPPGSGLPQVIKWVGFRIKTFEACSAFTRVTACTFAGLLTSPFHRRLRQLRCLHRRFDCYRLKRLLPEGTFTP